MENSGGIQASLSGRYAVALFDLARDGKKLDAVSASLATLKAAIAESADLRAFVTSPAIGRDVAVQTVAALGKTLKIDPLTANFLGVLAQNRRLSQLPAAIRAFDTLLSNHKGEARAEITSAHPLDDKQVASLRQALRSRVGREVSVDLKVDPAILGGLVVKVGSQMIDSSIRTRLNTLAQAMKG